MKIRLALLLALLCSIEGFAQFRGESVMADFAAEMSVNAEVQDRFFARYPDLKDETEVVAAAARALANEGAGAADSSAAAQAVAERAHTILARRTPQEWQRKAVSLFPELGVAGSEFNSLFLRHHAELQRTSPRFTEEPSWPVLLARRCADELKAREQAVAAAPAPPAPGSVTAVAPASAAPAQPVRRSGFWASAFSLVLLLAIVVQPVRWLWRWTRALAGRESPATLWQQALRPTGLVYLGFALSALFRTFVANADQSFIDRFGITLLVSLLAGLFFAIPGYAASLAFIAWRRRPRSVTANPRV